MGSDVTKARGMDELDRLILAADPKANKAKMFQWREYFILAFGYDKACDYFRTRANAVEQQRNERIEVVRRESQKKTAIIVAAKARKETGKKARPRKPVYLRADMVPTPNCIARSALFGIVRSGRRRRIEGYEELPMYGSKGWTIRWRGVRLDQADADVWLYLIRKAAEASSDFLNGQIIVSKTIQVEFTRNGLLKALRRAKGSRNREWLDQSITRLRDCDIQVEDPTGTARYSAKLLGDRYEDGNSDMEIVEVNATLANLLGKDLSFENFQKRLELGKNQLAKWLHGFLGSHKGPIYPVGIRKLHTLTESPLPIRVFKQRVKKALDEIKDVVDDYDLKGKGESAIFRIKLTSKKSR